jgi:hypothetical protein
MKINYIIVDLLNSNVMKKVLFLLMICALNVNAQFFFSSDKSYYTYYDFEEEKYKLIKEFDEPFLFEFNKDFTTLNQKSADAEFNYFINKFEPLDDKDTGWRFEAVDMHGTEYVIVIDKVSNNLRIMYDEQKTVDYMVQYEIKSTWKK